MIMDSVLGKIAEEYKGIQDRIEEILIFKIEPMDKRAEDVGIFNLSL